MRILIAETVALKPHLEIAGEIALCGQKRGDTIQFVWLGDGLPWSDWQLPLVARLVGCSLAPRIRRFLRILQRHGVDVLRSPEPERTTMRAVRAWADAFRGDLEALKNYRFDDALLGMGVASSLISWTRNSAYAPERDRARVRRCLLTAGLVYVRALAVLRAQKPEQLVTFNGRFATCKPVFEAAKKLGVPVVRHERGATYDRYALYEDAVHNYSYIRGRICAAWDAASIGTREETAHAFYQRRRNGDGIYWYSFTDHMQPGFIPPRVAGKRRVVYFSSSDDEYAAVTDVFNPRPWPNQLAALAALMRCCAQYPDIELVVRVHPNMRNKAPEERARWSNLQNESCVLLDADHPADSYALIDSADIVVSYGSTIGMEAAYWGKPSVLIGPCSYQNSGAVYEPGDAQALQQLLAAHAGLKAPDRAHCLPYGFYHLTFGTPFYFYQPTSLSEGMFVGERLGWDPGWVYWLRKKGLGAYLRAWGKRT